MWNRNKEILNMKERILLTGAQRGFFSHVFQLLTHYMNDSNTLYYPYYINSLYSNTIQENMWDYYFEQPFTIDKNTKYEIGDWFYQYSIPQNPTILERYTINNIIQKYIILKPEIEMIYQNYKSNLPSNYMSVQKRGTDHSLHGEKLDITDYFNAIDKHIDKYEYLYIATDESISLEQLKNRYGNKIIANDFIRSDDLNTPIHFSKGLQTPKQMGIEVLMDSLIMANSKFLINTLSGVSHFSIFYNTELEYERIDKNIKYK